MGRRLVIQGLVLENFKSYAGRQEIGPFNSSFTAVVGPNGSGKSNVIDSLLFVFGFRAKKMRHDKLSNLIHNSDEFPDCRFARVEVHFGYAEALNTAAEEGPLDETLVVARDVTREGGSSYYINGRTSNYGEVTTLLKQKGIDLEHKRFLILQGEVEQIALMRPKADEGAEDGLLEYLEDIIGTTTLKKRIVDLEPGLDELKQAAAETESRATAVAKDVTKLDKRRAEIEEYCRAANSATMARSHLWQLELSQARCEEKVATGEAEAATTEMKELEAQLEAIRISDAEAIRRASELENNIASQKADVDRLSKTLNKARVAAIKAQKSAEQLTSKRAKLETDLKKAENEHHLEVTWLASNEEAVSEATARAAELRDMLAVEQANLDKIQEALSLKTRPLAAKIEALSAQAAPSRDVLRAAEVRTRELDALSVRLEESLAQLREQESEATIAARKISNQGSAAREEVKRSDHKMRELTARREQLTAARAEAEANMSKADAEVSDLRPRARAAQQAMTAARSQNYRESRLLELRDQHHIKGLYGRLGLLASIDEKYDVAVSTAAPELNNFVVDTVATAEKCIDLMRKHRIGATRFMVLEKQPPPRPAPVPLPKGAQRLYDLIRPVAPEFAAAFYAVLGDTLVTDTLDEARKVAYHSGNGRRYRVVSIDGALVTPSGAMTGGGAPSRGLLARNAAPIGLEETEKLEMQLKAAQMDQEAARSQLEQTTGELTAVGDEISALTTELEMAQRTVAALLEQFQSLKTRRDGIRAEVATAEEALASSRVADQTERKELTERRAQAAAACEPIEEQIQAIRSQILDIGGLELRLQTSKVRSLSDQQAEAVRRRTELDEEHARRGGIVRRLDSQLSTLRRELEKPDEIEAAKANVQEHQRTIQELEERAAIAQKQMMQLEIEWDDAKAATHESQLETTNLRSTELEVRSRIESASAQRDQAARRRGALSAKIAELTLYNMADLKALPDPRKARQQESQEVATGTAAIHKSLAPSTEILKAESEDEMMAEGEEEDYEQDLVADSVEECQLRELTPDELDSLNISQLRLACEKADKVVSQFKARYDGEALEEYSRRHAEWTMRQSVADDAVAEWKRVKSEVERLKRRRTDEFMAGFSAISAKLKEMYSLLTAGGNAELELVDTLDPFAEGILFSVMPPRKSWRNISDLSGGEKTLSSLALVFALHHFKPTPLYVMDEIDAALDFRNVSIIAGYIRERTQDGQFVVISLRNNMFENASRLVGVTKHKNRSRSVAFNAFPEPAALGS